MRKVEAIIRSSKLGVVEEALHVLGIEGLTITEVQGTGHQHAPKTFYRGAARDTTHVPKVKIETVVSDDEADEAVDAILTSAHTGEVGDGRIFVTDLASVVRIRTGETVEAGALVGG